mgnify:CR=1 FL=1
MRQSQVLEDRHVCGQQRVVGSERLAVEGIDRRRVDADQANARVGDPARGILAEVKGIREVAETARRIARD